MAQIVISAQNCEGCGACVDTCQNQVLSLKDDKAEVTSASMCVFCLNCIDICNKGAISMGDFQESILVRPGKAV